MKFLRPLLLLALIIGTVHYGFSRTEHHHGDSAFQTLYMHLLPSRLLDKQHEEVTLPGYATGVPADGDEARDAQPVRSADRYLLSVELPGPALFDMDHEIPGNQLIFTNLQLFQLLAVLLILVAFSGVPRFIRTGEGDPVTRVFTGFVLWVRDEMVYPVMGRETGRRFLPYFLALFFFVLFMNLLGLVPGAATATASIFVTAALGVITLGSMIVSGMATQGPIKFFTSQVPHVPALIWPLMFVVEVVGLLVVKPFALTVRLFANMTGGHMVVLSFMALIFFFAEREGAAMGWASSPVAVGFAVFIMIIEAFVAMLQAYIFTQLSVIFVQSCVHPEH